MRVGDCPPRVTLTGEYGFLNESLTFVVSQGKHVCRATRVGDATAPFRDAFEGAGVVFTGQAHPHRVLFGDRCLLRGLYL